MKLFELKDYKKFIKLQIKSQNQGRGYRSKLAAAAKCQKSYFSQVVNAGAQLTSEQAIGLCLFWKLSELETEYFLELVNLEKTSFGPLRNRIERRLKEIKSRHEDSNMQALKKEFSDEGERLRYYSSWHYSAVHILTSIQNFQSLEAIAARLELPQMLVKNVLDELSKMKLVTPNSNGKWTNVPGGLHNPPGTSIAGMHHQNWRQRAMLDYFRPKQDHLHYTDVHSLSISDFVKLRDFFFEKIDEFRKVVKPSPEEEMACLCIDYFRA